MEVFMNHLMQANRQWATRPHDQRFLSLIDLAEFCRAQRDQSSASVVSSRQLHVRPDENDVRKGLLIEAPNAQAVPTHWSFGQIAQLVGAPASYLRDHLPAPIVADCLNYGLRFSSIDDVGILLTQQDGTTSLRAATGPRYGRIWNAEIADTLVSKFGDGLTGDWRVPGEFGRDIVVTKENTTIYGSDRDLFVFLADERNRIEVPNRRDGKTGTMARGFFLWNSEVGASTIGGGFFLFDYVCCNRIVWGAQDFTEVRLRHTSGAPDRWLEEIEPVLIEYAQASAKPVLETIANARSKRLDDVDKFLAQRFGKKMAADVKAAHEADEGHPIETLWDATNALTAYARLLPYQDRRVDLEREAGKLLQLGPRLIKSTR
jgi:hypothetical protein